MTDKTVGRPLCCQDPPVQMATRVSGCSHNIVLRVVWRVLMTQDIVIPYIEAPAAAYCG